MDYKACLKYEDHNELSKAIKRLNDRYRLGSRAFDLKINAGGKHEIKVTDKSDLVPYGIFEIGTYLGQNWMHKYFRIELGDWQKSINKELFKDEYYPQYEKVKIALRKNQIVEFKIKDAIGITSSINTIKPFLNHNCYKRIAEYSEFKLIENTNSKIHISKDDLMLNYHILSDQLLIFGIKIDYTNNHYEVKLISVFEIKKSEYDF